MLENIIRHRTYIGSGVLITRVTPLGPAAKAGLLANDILLEINGHKV